MYNMGIVSKQEQEMTTKAKVLAEVTKKVIDKANARNIALCPDSLNWVVNTLLADIACGFSDSRMHRHMNSMLTRVKDAK